MDKELKSALKSMEGRINKRFDTVDKKFEVIDKRFDVIDERFGIIDQRFGSIESRMSTKEDISEVLNVVRDVASNTGRMIEKLQDDVTSQGQQLSHLAKRVDYIEEKAFK